MIAETDEQWERNFTMDEIVNMQSSGLVVVVKMGEHRLHMSRFPSGDVTFIVFKGEDNPICGTLEDADAVKLGFNLLTSS